MQSYSRYSFVKLIEAKSAIKNLPINEIPTDLLYTEFDSCRRLVEEYCRNSHQVYHKKLYESNKTQMVKLGSELLRRGVRVIF